MAVRRKRGGRRVSRASRERKRQARIRRASARIVKLIKRADTRGYTGMVGSKGSAMDQPGYKSAMKAYDRACEI